MRVTYVRRSQLCRIIDECVCCNRVLISVETDCHVGTMLNLGLKGDKTVEYCLNASIKVSLRMKTDGR